MTSTWDSCTHGKGRLCALADSIGTTTYTLDSWGRVTAKTQAVAGLSLKGRLACV